MSKKQEIQQKARSYYERLFPRVLQIIDTKYDYHFQSKLKLKNPKDEFKKVKLDIIFENFSLEQKEYLFDLLDKAYDAFMKKKWFEFNYLTNLILDGNNKIELPEEVSFFGSNEFLSTTESIIEERRNLISQEYQELKDDMINIVFRGVEPKGQIEEEIDSNEFYDYLDSIRNRDYTYLELFDTVKSKTNLERVPLEYFKQDVELYLFTTKETHEVFFTQEDIDKALHKLEDKGYTREDLIKQGYLKKSLIINNDGTKDDKEESYYVDKEKLLFPFEFYPIYELLRIVNKELQKHQDLKNLVGDKERLVLKTELSVPQLAFLFKMLNDLKPKLFDLKSEAELYRFISANIQTKKSDPEKGISESKLRILFNTPDPKAAEFWEKHIHTIQAEIKKIK